MYSVRRAQKLQATAEVDLCLPKWFRFDWRVAADASGDIVLRGPSALGGVHEKLALLPSQVPETGVSLRAFPRLWAAQAGRR
jgi:hypothetical protein